MAETLRAIHDHIIFQFEDKIAKHRGTRHFREETDWGFQFATSDDTLETGRWVRVTHVGHKVPDEIKPGMRICVEKQKWTQSFQFEDEDYWRTDYENILLIDESVPASP